jgi:RNA polymerase sigma-70 factor (ECF subfamily)
MPGLSGHLPFGLIRRALRDGMRKHEVHLGSHDPDGHLFVISHAHKMPLRGNI